MVKTYPEALDLFLEQWPNKPWTVGGANYDKFNPERKSYRHAMEAALGGETAVKIEGMFTKGTSILFGSLTLRLRRGKWQVEKIKTV